MQNHNKTNNALLQWFLADTADQPGNGLTCGNIIKKTTDAFKLADEELSIDQKEALMRMHPDRHEVLQQCAAVIAKNKTKSDAEFHARETKLFKEYLQVLVEAQQEEVL